MFVALELFEPFARILEFFYNLWPSYAGSIALFTLAIMVVLTPLTLKGTRSMMQLQALQPEMKKIQAQYKDDRQKLNEELLKFYKENNINPLGGCLPLLVQLPVFIILYNVLKGLTHLGSDGTFAPQYLDHSRKLYRVGQQALISRTIYNTPEAKKLLEQQMKDAEERKKSGAPKGGFFQQLLGDAAPQLNKDRATNNKDKASTNGGKGASKPAPG